ncbi:S1 family peptidase [Glycomyces harbinensis]|uniref:S1 family peptidase n=1 Tax=Glycomyces harbinensis TaxID=58114 RepID=UPI0024805616|nr:serine protease [Glycomyces harbinensis]
MLVDQYHIVTCAHVVDLQSGRTGPVASRREAPAALARVEFPFGLHRGAFHARTVLWLPVQDNGDGDIAVLRLEHPRRGIEAAPLAFPNGMRGHRFSAHGFPEGERIAREATGILRGASGEFGNWVQLDADGMTGWAIGPGFSGAPVYDHEAEAVIGIVALRDGHRSGHLLPNRYLSEHWPRLLACDGSLAEPTSTELRADSEPNRLEFGSSPPVLESERTPSHNLTAWSDYWNPAGAGSGFVGRVEDMAALEEDLTGSSAVVQVCSIGGFGGIGKTALATAFGENHSADFDGRVFFDFQSYSLNAQPISAVQALRRILPVVLNQDPKRIAMYSAEELLTLWHSATANRRILMIWDNVSSSDQIEPLILRGRGCATIYTTRQALLLEGGSKTIRLDVLKTEDAEALFLQVAGSDHDRSRVKELVLRDLCVPVLINSHAQGVVSGKWSLADIVSDLPPVSESRRKHAARLQASLFERLFASYRRLDPLQRVAFRIFGSYPGRALSIGTLAGVLKCAVEDAEELILQLVDAGLAQREDDRTTRTPRHLRTYFAHDLIRAFGANQALQECWIHGRARDDRALVWSGLREYYSHRLASYQSSDYDWFFLEAEAIREVALGEEDIATAEFANLAAARFFASGRANVSRELFGHAAKIFWNAEDDFNYAAALRATWESPHVGGEEYARRVGRRFMNVKSATLAATGFDPDIWIRGDIFLLKFKPDEAEDAFRTALEACELMDDAEGSIAARLGLADSETVEASRRLTYKFNDDFAGPLSLLFAAERLYRGALRSARIINDKAGEAAALAGLGNTAIYITTGGVLWPILERARGIEMSQSSGDLVEWPNLYHERALERPIGGNADTALDLKSAKRHFEDALKLFRARRDYVGIADIYIGIGNMAIAQNSPDLEEAEKAYSTALATFEELGDGFGVARSSLGLGDVEFLKAHHADSHLRRYIRHYAKAIRDFDELHLGEWSARVRRFLAATLRPLDG